MMRIRHGLAAMLLAGGLGGQVSRASDVVGVKDVAAVQWVREFFGNELGVPANSITGVTLGADGSPWLVAAAKMSHLRAGKWETIALPIEVSAVVAVQDAAKGLVLAVGSDGVWSVAPNPPLKEANSPAGADGLLAVAGGDVWAVVNQGDARGNLGRAGGWKKLFDIDPAAGKVLSLCRLESGVVLANTSKGVFKVIANQPWTLLRSDVAQIAPMGTEHALLLSSKGLTVTDGAKGFLSFTGKDGLPIEALKCASAFGDSVWFGSDQGVVLWRCGRFTYFAGPRWLPDDHVTAIAAGAHGVWVATVEGLSHIDERSMTLAEKAEAFERQITDRPRRLGFVTVMGLKSPGDFNGAEQEISDNDGLWTAMYVAAECFRYASTHDENARKQAQKSMQALLRLESITGISGFPARAISNIHDPAHERRSGGQWNPSPVEKDWMWKGDTSSDEIVGHYLAFYLYSTLVANDAEKQQIRATCKRITDHILDHKYYLVDITGKPTRWGYWAPERLNGFGEGDRGLNSLELLSHLRVAIALVGDERYKSAYRDLIDNHHYALNTVRQRNGNRSSANHSDDELAFLSYYPLLMLETDPSLKAIYQASLRRTWEGVRPEACPAWNFIYGVCAHEPCDAELAIGALHEIPLDLIHWPTANARRADLKLDPGADRFARKQTILPLSWTERPLHKWNGNPYELDGGNPREEEDATFWLLPYWMGRYHHIIE